MRTFVIAEAGVNHNGSLDMAKKLVDVASDAGADSVKFQTFKTEKLVSRYAQKAEYQRESTDREESQFEMLKKLELSFHDYKKLFFYCKEKRIMFMSTPFDEGSADMLDKLGMEVFKIPSGEITNLPYLRRIASYGKKILLSTGMSNLSEIEKALDVLMISKIKKKDITILHCNTEYPTPTKDVNIRAMLTVKEAFHVDIGYSDHTLGIEIPVAAVALGASVIEKHFTLDKNMCGPDHKASLDPEELKAMLHAIRNVEEALGDGIKRPSLSELKNIPIVRKSIVAATNIRKGEIFSEDNVTVKRPGTGISPMEWDNILGRKAERNFMKDTLIEIQGGL